METKPIYIFEVLENQTKTIQFLANSDYDQEIAKEFKAIKHPTKNNIWYWNILENQDIKFKLLKSKKFIFCNNKNYKLCEEYFNELLNFEKLEPNTKKCYKSMIKMFLEHFPEIFKGKIPKKKEINLYFNNELKWKNSYINQHISAIKKLYFNVLQLNPNKYRVERPKNEVRIRKQMTNYQIDTFKNGTNQNSTTKLLFELCLDTGLKTNELANLRLEDILENKLKIKGKRNRIIGISESISEKINNYLNINNIENRKFLFSKRNGENYAPSTLQNFIKIERENLKLDQFCLKDLRHSFAIKSLNEGIDLEEFQQYLGFTNINSIFEYNSFINSNQRNENLNKMKNAS